MPITPALSNFLPEAQEMAALYGLLGQGLTPAILDGFPRTPGFTFFSHLTVSEKVLFWDEVSFMGFVAESHDEALIDILGTHDPLGWVKDIEANPVAWTTLDGLRCSVEAGFASVYSEITLQNTGKPLRSYIESLKGSGKRVRIRGHSLGAAVGGIVAADCDLPYFTLFAMPLFGDITLSQSLAAKADPASVVVHNVRDTVPTQPPFPLYQSVLPEGWFNSDALGVGGTLSERHSMAGCYLKACQPHAA